MSEQNKDVGSALLAKNKDKEDGTKQPDYKGWGEVNGEQVWLAGWIKQSDKGPFISLAFQERAPQKKGKAKAKSKSKSDDFDDEIPF